MLDHGKLLPQIRELTEEQLRRIGRMSDALEAAGSTLDRHGSRWEDVGRLVGGAHTSWLLATPLESFALGRACPPEVHPDEYIAVAADGSQIEPDRHEVAFCCLLNTGRVLLRYGPQSAARMGSVPSLVFREEDLAEEGRAEKLPLTGKHLALRRMGAECEALAALMESAAAEGVPALALWDGSLILWSLENEDAGFRGRMLGKFQAMLDAGRRLGVPVAGYISGPGSRDVVNTLRVCRCPHAEVDCDRHCPPETHPGRRATPCGEVAEATDAALFSQVLRPGERSAVFGSSSGILRHYRDEHRTRWFYLHAGPEIARVEIPAWVAEDAALLDRVHALARDQAVKGSGYPPSLAEAHECAVVRGADRQEFFRLVEAHFAQAAIPIRRTRKAITKRARFV